MRISLQFLLSIIALLCSLSIGIDSDLYGEADVESKIRTDDVLIAPGIGSHSILLGEPIDPLIRREGRDKFKISQPAAQGELFKDVFHVTINIKIVFDALYYNDSNNYALCVCRGSVVAIIGLIDTGITTEGVSLKSGINNFIFNYGNTNVTRIQGGSHGMYVYREKGIAVVDDDMNDSIDLYIVFSPQIGR